MPRRASFVLVLSGAACFVSGALVACDKAATQESAAARTGPAAPPPPAAEPPQPPLPLPPPEIIVESSRISIGTDRVQAGEQGLADKVGVFLGGRPGVAEHVVDVVVMRNAKPSEVTAVVSALRRAKASGVHVKTEARDGSTQTLPLSFASTVPDCATVAWIAKDAAIDVWPAGGGKAKRVIKGMAGPDMTLGTEAVRKQAASCAASEMVVGADDKLTWGLVFDLGTLSLQLPGARTSAAVLVDDAVPGRKIVWRSAQ